MAGPSEGKVLLDEKKVSKSPLQRVADTISSNNKVFADLKQVREEEKNKNRENSANQASKSPVDKKLKDDPT